MLLLNGAWVLTIQIAVFCLAAFAETGAAKEEDRREETGQWGGWGEWSTCSAECSSGITVRSRRCQHPHMLPVASLLSTGDDSVHCLGADKEIKLCNKQACEDGRGGWREEECAKYDASVHGGRRYTWQPFIHPSDPCKLTCRAKGHHFYSNLADRVVDGTPCAGSTTNPSAVCMQGQCKEVGCDDIVDSPWRLDVCGVCKGDNSTCRKISGIFTRQDLKRGMNQIAVIPAGSTRIRVKGLRYSNNWLALQTAEGDYVLNGGQKRSSGTELEVAGTVFTYRTKRRCAGQCLVAKGPTAHTLNLMLNTRGRNRGVMYSFNIPLNVSNSYFRRIINTARSKADVRNASSPHPSPPHRAHNNRHHGRHGHGRNVDRSNDSKSRSSNENKGNAMSKNNEQVEVAKESANKNAPDQSNDENDLEKGSEENDVSREAVEESAEEEEEESDSDSRPEENGVKSSSSDEPMSPASSSNEGEAEAVGSNPQAKEDGGRQESGEENKQERRMNITHKEKPRFIDAHGPSKHSFANRNRTLELQANSQAAERDSEIDNPHDSNRDQGSVASDSEDSDDEADTPANEELVEAQGPASAEDEEEDSEMSDLPSDQQPEVSAEKADPLGRLQNDGPRQQYYAAYRAQSRHDRRRPWRRFRRPNFSQSFTFRGRRRHGNEDRNDRRYGARPGRPVHVDSSSISNSRRIRYRQQPHSQVPQSVRPSSPYWQRAGGRPTYPGSNAQVPNRQPSLSQRQALRAGHSVSQNQEGNLQLANRNRQPQRGNVNVPQPPPQGGSRPAGQQSSASEQQEEYNRQLMRRRQLIEQQIAAQNAEYQRRLEERNQRLRQQHLERQQQRYRHQNQNASHVSHHQVKPSQGLDSEDRQRQRPSQERNREALPVSSLSGTPESRSPPSQPEESVSTQRHVHLQSTPPPPGPNNPAGQLGAGGRGRPLIISNRRPTHPQEAGQPVRSAGQPEDHSGRGRNNDRQPDSRNVLAQGSRQFQTTPYPVPSHVNIPESVSGQRPLIISNRRQISQPEQSSFHSSVREPVGPPSPSGHGADRASSPVQPSDNQQRNVDSPVTPSSAVNNADSGNVRKWPLFISNRRPEPGSPSAAAATIPPPGVEAGAAQPTERTPHSGFQPSHPHGSSQSSVASQARQPVDPSAPEPSVPDVLPSQARPSPSAAGGPDLVPNQPRQPGDPSVAGISPSLASLGGGFVAPQYIPENTRNYNGRSELSASSPNQLPSGGESPLVIGGEGNVVPNAVESGVAIGGGGSSLGIEEAGDAASYVWRVSGLTECTLTCGGGVQQTVVVCLDTRTQAFVTDDNCLHVQRPETKALTCNTRPCPAQWEASQWSACSVSCGAGEQTRLVQCLARISPTLNVTMADENCQANDKPELTQQCQNVACNSWKTGNWSECSVQCGEGVRTRDVYCTDHTGYDVSEELCTAAGSKPSQQEACVEQHCGKAGWYYTGWPEECPARCGAGSMKRQVACLGDGGAAVPESNCNDSSRPPKQQDCSVNNPCGGQWFATEWSQCNVTCGSGHQEREVICMKGQSEGLLSMAEEENCPADEKPISLQSCEMEPCLSEWYMTSWTECSQSCGRGQRSREVKCLDPQRRPSSQCAPADQPVSQEACNLASCVTTTPPAPAPAAAGVSECRDTFSRCQLVKHARMCRFSFYRKKCCATCSGDT